MMIEFNNMTLQDELDAAKFLLSRINTTIASGYSLIHDELEAAEDLRIICWDFCETYDEHL